ncbi:MAG: NAD(P)/FAD-dependent oxidoreductase [Proteobacteria bacterium]|nr:NAD(P)/FAD-dependent oxidoreductase [Pseudomonadota bacterium]MBU1737403.1 NAD(P)/FAD-dependent oxidoreductase [Pseudomonadota bacterium]
MDVAVIGGGAAGFFAALAVKENYPQAKVVIFEKSENILAKVRISGGGRCNVTNGCTEIRELLAAYPRGGRVLKKAFRVFNTAHAMRWFETRGVPLVLQDDNCVFPASQDSQSIIDCFLHQAKKHQVAIRTGCGVKAVRPVGDGLQLVFSGAAVPARTFAKVIVTTGGSPQRKGLTWLEELGHKIEEPVPSLFTFSMPGESVTALQGIVVADTIVCIPGTKLKGEGPLLITHWGMSGPAILKLSSFGARLLHAKEYHFPLQVNWAAERNNDQVLNTLNGIVADHGNKLLTNFRPYSLPDRLWRYLLEKSGLPQDKKWCELGRKGLNKLLNLLTGDEYPVQGKSTFREEFVTCGGISLDSIDGETMQSKVCKNLYFAGEILDIDGITGGYNFQAAWTTAFIAGKLQ